MIGGWIEQAACGQTDPALFDGTTDQDRLAAAKICAGCPVLAMCHADAAQRGFGLRATEQVRAGLWWDTRGVSHKIRPARPVVTAISTPTVECDGHAGSRWRWNSGNCRGEGCREANRLYEAAYYARRRALRTSQAA